MANLTSPPHQQWLQYPKQVQPCEATIYLNVRDDTNVTLLVNIEPNSALSDAYSIDTTLPELREFIKGIYLGHKGMEIKQSGLCYRRFNSLGKYTFSDAYYFWKLPVSYQTLTTSHQAVSELYRDFCSSLNSAEA